VISTRWKTVPFLDLLSLLLFPPLLPLALFFFSFSPFTQETGPSGFRKSWGD